MQFEHYDARLAQGLAASYENAGGLVAFLGLRKVRSVPGELDVELDVRPTVLVMPPRPPA
jgi:hypothetical protein